MFAIFAPIVPMRAHFGPAMDTTGAHSVSPYPSSTVMPSFLKPSSTCRGHGAPPTIMNRSRPPRPFFTAPNTSFRSPSFMRRCAFFDALSFASILS